jgi:hypothetical protein
MLRDPNSLFDWKDWKSLVSNRALNVTGMNYQVDGGVLNHNANAD